MAEKQIKDFITKEIVKIAEKIEFIDNDYYYEQGCNNDNDYWVSIFNIKSDKVIATFDIKR